MSSVIAALRRCLDTSQITYISRTAASLSPCNGVDDDENAGRYTIEDPFTGPFAD